MYRCMSVNNANCIRPWSIPYVVLMDKVNRKRIAAGTLTGDPDSYENLTRPFTNEDRLVLNSMTEAERTFNLKMGAGNGNQTTVTDPPPEQLCGPGQNFHSTPAG